MFFYPLQSFFEANDVDLKWKKIKRLFPQKVKLSGDGAYSDGDVKKIVMEYGAEWEIWPINYFVFALDSMKLTTIVNELNKKNQEEGRETSKRIDCICVLNEGVIMNKLENSKYNALPEPGSVLIVSLTKKPLLFFYRLISNHLLQAWMPPFQFTEYTKNVRY